VSNDVVERNGVAVLVCAADGPTVSTPQDALDVLGEAFGRAGVVALPVERLDPAFFELRTGIAGEIMQKFVNYRTQLAIVGDIEAHVAGSESLAALVRESNRGRHIWFVDDLDDLDGHLG
jgi:Domain of unknown function (DUF4180)